MNKYSQIQSSKIKIDQLYKHNHHIHHSSMLLNRVGESYSTPHLYNEPEIDYKKDPWEYHINKHGFRGGEWTFEKSPAFFGCSCTFGIGVNTPASELLAKRLNIPNIPNLGMPGSSIANIIKVFTSFIRLYPVSDAFIILPPPGRVFLPEYDTHSERWHYDTVLVNHYGTINKKRHKQIFSVFTEDVSACYATDYIDWANVVAKQYGTTIHWMSWDEHTFNDYLLNVTDNPTLWNLPKPPARDRAHPGVAAHNWLANACYKLIDNSSNR